MKLKQENLHRYFRIADKETSWYSEPTNTYDFVNRNSKELLITIGDSWTYGATLPQDSRQTQVYGCKLSKKLNSDWLNLGLPAVSNFWITDRAEEVAMITSELDYEKVYVVCVFTGIARQFDTTMDRYINYEKWFSENYDTKEDFSKVFLMLNSECVNRIQRAFKNLRNVEVFFGTNFIEQLGFETLPKKQILFIPWYKLLMDGGKMDTYHDASYFRLEQALQWVPMHLKDDFKIWILELIEQSETRENLLNRSKYFKDCHPLDYGHTVWAEYVYKKLK